MTLFPGSGNWRSEMQNLGFAVNDVMGELVLVTPATTPKVNYPSIDDITKAVSVVATFTNKSKTVIMGNEGRAGGLSVSPLVQTSEPIFQFARDILPFPLKQHYRIARYCNGARYEVTNVKDDGVAFIYASVVILGRPGRDD
jgi:hypothetical protein